MSAATTAGRLAIKVYYEDTDTMGVVYYANYLRYMERGRTEMIDTTGHSVAEWSQSGCNIAVYKANLTYLAPARLGEIVEVVTRLVSNTPYRLVLDQQVVRGETRLVRGEIHLVCLDDELSLRQFPAELLAALPPATGA